MLLRAVGMHVIKFSQGAGILWRAMHVPAFTLGTPWIVWSGGTSFHLPRRTARHNPCWFQNKDRGFARSFACDATVSWDISPDAKTGNRLHPSGEGHLSLCFGAAYPAPATSRQVGSISITWPTASVISPGRWIPRGQYVIKGVEIPPSWFQRLNWRNGVLLRFAQGKSTEQ